MDSGKLFIVAILFGLVVQTETDMDVDRFNEGKRQFELLRYKSEMPRYGQCWVDAMTMIQTGCKRLTDETQSRLALAYLNCFLRLQDLETYPCHSDMEIGECTKSIRESDRSSFTTFFTHTQNICYFLQAQIWHEETELTISRLADRSSQVASQLEASHRLQEDMLNSQSQSLHNQERLMDGTDTLRGIINSSSDNIRALFEDLKTSTLEQRQIIGDVFDQLLNLQSTILGEVSGFYSLFFYILSLLVCYLITSTARTSGARLWLFLVMTLNIVMEQTVMRWIAGWGSDDEDLYWLQKCCRRLSLLVCVAILSACAYMFRDINEINNQLLTEIRKQNSDIKRFMSGQHGQSLSVQSGNSSSTMHDCTSDSDYTSDNNDGYSDDDDDDGNDSDHTFILEDTTRLSDRDDADSHNNSANVSVDLETSSVSLMSELGDLRRSTPIREMESHIHSWLNQSQAGEGHSDSPVMHSYNLRRRTNQPSVNQLKISPALKVESPNSFSRTVRHLQKVSEKNSRLLRAEIGASQVQSASQVDNQRSAGTPLSMAVSSSSSSQSMGRHRLHHQVTPAGDINPLISSTTTVTPSGSRNISSQMFYNDAASAGSRSSRSSKGK